MPYCKIEVDDQRPKTDSLSKDQSVLIQLDAMKFKNIPPEKAEGGFSNRCFPMPGRVLDKRILVTSR